MPVGDICKLVTTMFPTKLKQSQAMQRNFKTTLTKKNTAVHVHSLTTV